jgi:hypothetical protein
MKDALILINLQGKVDGLKGLRKGLRKGLKGTGEEVLCVPL